MQHNLPFKQTSTSLADTCRWGGKPITPKEEPTATNVVNLMEALRRSVGQEAAPAKTDKPIKKPRKGAAGQKEMLMSIAGQGNGGEEAA